jgi:hypothetical protein
MSGCKTSFLDRGFDAKELARKALPHRFYVAACSKYDMFAQ